ncbi:MAG: beta-lactamase family protein [Clostridia bacterium]|nr:beta-lactamase family protein [Clostridia bacterium]
MNTTLWQKALDDGIAAGAFPCYAAAVGCGDELYFRSVGGLRAHFPSPLPLTDDALFDMASLTKLMGTTMAALRLIDRGTLRLTDTLGRYFDCCYGKESLTVFDLMTHTSGLPAHAPLWQMGISPEDAVRAILSPELTYPTGSKVVYSCMGFIVLGKLLERASGMTLDALVQREVLQPLGLHDTCYNPAPDRICVSTEKKAGSEHYICGHVHDENAHFLGGVSGNAGLFSTLRDTARFAAMLSRRGEGYLSRELFDLAITDHTTADPEDARGLGFDLYRSGTCPGGCRLSRGSYGHTGFTGTTLYVDRDSGVYVLLLSNRVHFGRSNDTFYPHRRGFFDTVMGDLKQ